MGLIQSLKNELEKKDLLIREAHHRIKNNTGAIESLLHMQSEEKISAEAKQALNQVIGRVGSILFPLGIMVNELVRNAVKYAFPSRQQGSLRLRAYRSEHQIVLTVEDDGTGLPAGYTPGSTGGLGLAMAGMLVEQIDGTISFSSENGTKVTIEFGAEG
jgi:two-component sensor histidine kinase